jgi:hypothetical protein
VARGQYRLGLGALLLAFANIVGIQVAGSIVMWLGGYRGEKAQYPTSTGIKRNVLSVTVLCILAVLLSLNLRRLIMNELYETSVRKILKDEGATHKGAYLEEVRFQRDFRRDLVVAVYRTPAPFTPDEIGAIEPKLPMRPGAHSLELRIRSVPVVEASKSGYLDSARDLSKRAVLER